jgi:hypothetical protein
VLFSTLSKLIRERKSLIIGLTIISFWISVFFSYTLVSSLRISSPFPHDYYETDIFAKGGFPFVVFYYPIPPLGSDLASIPLASAWWWKVFLLDVAFWLLAVTVLVISIPERIFQYFRWLHISAVVTTAAVLSCISGLIYLLRRFD